MNEEFNPTCILVTGGAGFIGGNFIRWVLGHDPSATVVNLDALTYAGNVESLADLRDRHGPAGDGRYYFLHGDIRSNDLVVTIMEGNAQESDAIGDVRRPIPRPDAVVHFAAESHVDRSIVGPADFIDTNVRGTLTLLEACRATQLKRGLPFRFLHVSTDEVYGSLDPADAAFTENTPLAPNSPYAASKAASDLVVRSYVHTYGLPAVITRCSNNYGPYQFPEKLIPLMITRALTNQSLPVYGDGLNVRDWIHVEDHAAALWSVLKRGAVGEVYNIGTEREVENITLVRLLLRLVGKSEGLIRFVADRPGHDRRYALSTKKIRTELEWRPVRNFEEGIESTVRWYVDHPAWWGRVLSEAYRVSNMMYLGNH